MSTFRHFPESRILELFKAALDVGASSLDWQTTVLKGIDPSVEAAISAPAEPSLRLLTTLHHLNAIERLADGGVPFHTWLRNACALGSARAEAEVFRLALAVLEEIAAADSRPTSESPPASVAPRRRGPESLSAGQYLRLHEQARGAVERMNGLAAQLGWTSLAARVDALRETLCQDPYRVAIAGKSRAGKSTLMNALIGRALCPVQRVTTTAVPIIIGPGEPERVTVTFEKREPHFIDGPIEAAHIAPYADQRHNPDNKKLVREIQVELAHEVLALGIQYVDIPGFDDPSRRIWSATDAVIASSHALVLVMDVAPYETGGFAVDRQTIEFLQRAQGRGCSLFVVCNKAEALESELHQEVRAHIRERLEEFHLWAMLPHPPFFLSAKAAVEARKQGRAEPQPYEEFGDALWRTLWNTESNGLRRLSRVFEHLRIASDEVATLIAVRDAKEPERVRLRDALNRCARDQKAIQESCRRVVEEVRATVESRVAEVARAQLPEIAGFMQSLVGAAALPRPSEAVDTLSERIRPLYSKVVDEVGQEVLRSLGPVEPRVARSLAYLREQVELPPAMRHARETLLPPEDWQAQAAVPTLDDVKARERKVWAGGIAAGAGGAIVMLAGGPVGWALIVGGLLWGAGRWAVDELTNTSKSRGDLEQRLKQHFGGCATSLRQRLDEALSATASLLVKRVAGQMAPFIQDMRKRLDDIRPPTDEERQLYAALSDEIRHATLLLAETFRTEQGASPAPTNATNSTTRSEATG